ncbi:nucleotidyltransferase substrate binding protein [Flavobacterium sp. ZS1P14]|uniref:nucleotidyltransferase substrate binding protein n=1 Tax=Flavobacterium sp. ZS1P14 TaxID=3401729 RepID=UPI003AAD42F8
MGLFILFSCDYWEQLKNAFEIYKTRELTVLENQGVIQAFEVTQGLSWKVMKDFLEYQGYDEIYGSKNAVRLAFNVKIINNGEIWMDMIKSRNLMSHTYDEDEMLKIIKIIFEDYIQEFENFKVTMLAI